MAHPAVKFLAPIVATLLTPLQAFACRSCFAGAEGDQIIGVNFAVMTLVGVTGVILIGFIAFFIYLARRAASFGSVDLNTGDA